MRARVLTTISLLLASAFAADPLLTADSALVGQGADEHYDCTGAEDSRCLDGVTLTFGSLNGAAVLAVEFAVREDAGEHLRTAPTQIRVMVTPLARASTGRMDVSFRISRQDYPLATRADPRGFVVGLITFDTFTRLAHAPTVTGSAFGQRFAATRIQMTALRSVATRWAVQGTTFERDDP